MNRIALIAALVFAAAAPPVRADVAADLSAADRALMGWDLDAAAAAYRRAFEAEQLTDEQRRRAADGLLAAAVAAGNTGELLAYYQGRLAGVPEHLARMLLAERTRCQKALDGHLHSAIARLKQEAGDDRNARHALSDAERLRSRLGTVAQGHAGRWTTPQAKAWRPPAESGGRRPGAITVPAAERPAYSPTPVRLKPPREPRQHRAGHYYRVAPPRPVRYSGSQKRAVRKPRLVRPRVEALAAAFLSLSYRKATALAAEGFFESAKAELAAVIQLFPDSSQAAQAAQYAIRLFQRERGVADHAQASALVAYLEWIRAVAGPAGLEYAEYQALKRFSGHSDAAIVAREAEAFIQRHPDSKFLTGARLQLAIALDSLGDSRRAIDVLRAIVSPIESTYNVRAVKLLAWLYLFEGQPEEARKQFQALAAQGVSEQAAADARMMLERMAKTPPAAVRLLVPDDPEEAEILLAQGLYDAGARILAAGDPERAMDLFELFLRLGKDTPNYWAARQRIERLRQKGQADGE